MVEPKVLNPSIHIVDMNMAIAKSKVTKEHVFKVESQSRISLLLTRKRSIDYNKLLLRLYKRCK
jgi:hypothetical protein